MIYRYTWITNIFYKFFCFTTRSFSNYAYRFYIVCTLFVHTKNIHFKFQTIFSLRILWFPVMTANNGNLARTELTRYCQLYSMVNKHLLRLLFLLNYLEAQKESKEFSIFCSQDDQTKLEIGKIYDQSSGKYIWSCPMTECYFDPCHVILFEYIK